MTMSYDTQYLERCRELIEEKCGWPPAREWRNFEFAELSDRILESTSVQLSTTTLKRIFGKLRYESLPSSVTLNALAKYLGYENWMQFKTTQILDEKAKQDEPFITTTVRPAPRFSRKAILAAITAGVIVALSGFVLFTGSSSSSTTPAKDVVFTSRPLAKGLPNSVVFNIDLKQTRSNDIILQQSWDSTKTVRLQPGQTEATAIYYIPGYFRAKLIVDKKIIKEHDLFIRSGDWMATIDHDPVPTYVRKEDLVVNKGMCIAPPVLDEIKKTGKPVTLTYHLVRPFEGLHSDNFTLETSFQNTYSEGPAVCKTTKLFVLCSNGAFIIPFTIPGCASNINLKLNDRVWEGRSNDLSVFGIDPSQKIHLKLEVKNRTVKIFGNGKLLREEKYNASAGDIVGLKYSFLGAGAVDNIRFLNEEGIPVYLNNFRGR